MSRTRKTRPPSIRYPKFPYSDYDLIESELPWFITSTLNNVYMSPERRHDFVVTFVYKYLDDENYREIVQGKFLVFEGTKFIDVGDENFRTMGDPERPKNIVRIGDPVVNFMFGVMI